MKETLRARGRGPRALELVGGVLGGGVVARAPRFASTPRVVGQPSDVGPPRVGRGGSAGEKRGSAGEECEERLSKEAPGARRTKPHGGYTTAAERRARL